MPCGGFADVSALPSVRGQTTSPVLPFEKLSNRHLITPVHRAPGTEALNAEICPISSPDSLPKDLNLALDEVPTVATGSHFLPLALPSPPSLAHVVRNPTLVLQPVGNSPTKSGWTVVARKRTPSPLQIFCARGGRCFKCGLRGHLKRFCRFNGFCFKCHLPNHSVSICRFFHSSNRRHYFPERRSLMAGHNPQFPVAIPPSDDTYD